MPEPSSRGLTRVEHVMGTAISLTIADDLPAAVLERLADETFEWLREVDETFSTYRPESEVSRLARGELRLKDCGPHVNAVLDRCAELWRATGGYFDLHAGGSLDPSGYVKGWSVQVACDRLRAAGSVDHCLNAGGDVYVAGSPRHGDLWRIGIRHPWDPLSVAWVVNVSDCAVATSGTYERGAHVVDPYTGAPATVLRSVTVVGPDLGTADAYATAALAMGCKGLDWLAQLDGYESAVVTEDGEGLRTDGLPLADGGG